MTRSWWFSSRKTTVFVDEENEIITDTASITCKSIGQHIKKLADWMRSQGGFEWSRLSIEMADDGVDDPASTAGEHAVQEPRDHFGCHLAPESWRPAEVHRKSDPCTTAHDTAENFRQEPS